MINIDDDTTWPRLFTKWMHSNGNIYIVSDFTNIVTTDQVKYPTTIIYFNAKTKALYSRPLKDWDRSMNLIKEHGE